MAYTRSMRAPRVRVKSAHDKMVVSSGFKAGVLACAWVINEMVELDKGELTEIVQQSLKLMYDIGERKIDAEAINNTLEDMTGINIMGS